MYVILTFKIFSFSENNLLFSFSCPVTRFDQYDDCVYLCVCLFVLIFICFVIWQLFACFKVFSNFILFSSRLFFLNKIYSSSLINHKEDYNVYFFFISFPYIQDYIVYRFLINLFSLYTMYLGLRCQHVFASIMAGQKTEISAN